VNYEEIKEIWFSVYLQTEMLLDSGEQRLGQFYFHFKEMFKKLI